MRIRRGASALEFALTLPVVLVILAGILEYGWYLFQLANVVHALRDGARIGVTVPLDDATPPTARAESHARAVLSGLGVPCDSGGGCVVVASIGSTGEVDVLNLSIEVDYTPVVGLLPSPSHLHGTFTMMMQEQTADAPSAG